MLPFLLGAVFEPKFAVLAAIVVVIAILLVWKLAKFALKIAVIVVAAIILWFVLHNLAHVI